MDELNSKGLCALSAVAGAAVVLQASGAIAAQEAVLATQPLQPQESSWTVAQAQSSNSNQLLNPLGLSANWATLIAQPESQADCCFSSATAAPKMLLSSTERSDTEIYLLLALTLWFGATAPWMLRQFWLSQQQFAYGHPRRTGRTAQRAAQQRSKQRAAQRRAAQQRIRQRHATPLYNAASFASQATRRDGGSFNPTASRRFAKPRDHVSEVEFYPWPADWQPSPPQPATSQSPTRKALPALQPA